MTAAAMLPRLDLGTVGMGLGIGLVAAIALFAIAKNAGSVGELAGQAVGGTAGGAVLGLGDSIGVPRTDDDECTRALAEGRTWEASFACPAGRFVRSIFGSSDPAPVPIGSPYSINPRDRT